MSGEVHDVELKHHLTSSSWSPPAPRSGTNRCCVCVFMRSYRGRRMPALTCSTTTWSMASWQPRSSQSLSVRGKVPEYLWICVWEVFGGRRGFDWRKRKKRKRNSWLGTWEERQEPVPKLGEMRWDYKCTVIFLFFIFWGGIAAFISRCIKVFLIYAAWKTRQQNADRAESRFNKPVFVTAASVARPLTPVLATVLLFPFLKCAISQTRLKIQSATQVVVTQERVKLTSWISLHTHITLYRDGWPWDCTGKMCLLSFHCFPHDVFK